MANYLGSNSIDDVMGAGTETAGTPASDRWSSGRGDDTFIYEPSKAGGADRFSGGLGKENQLWSSHANDAEPTESKVLDCGALRQLPWTGAGENLATHPLGSALIRSEALRSGPTAPP